MCISEDYPLPIYLKKYTAEHRSAVYYKK